MATEKIKFKGINDRILTMAEACEILGVSKSTMQRWDREGKLKALRTPGNQRRYKESDIQMFLDGKIGGYEETAELSKQRGYHMAEMVREKKEVGVNVIVEKDGKDA